MGADLGTTLLCTLMLCSAVLAAVPEPQNVTMHSVNLGAILEWESPNLDGTVTYTAEVARSFNKEYLPKCILTNETRCDFTALINSFDLFDFRVKSHYKGEESPWVYIQDFDADRDTKVGPPSNISVQSILGKINVDISDPVLKLKDKQLSEIYFGISYNVMYWKKNETGKMKNVKSSIRHVVLEEVDRWTFYCIQVNIEILNIGKIGQTSEPVCIHNDSPALLATVPEPQNVTMNSFNFGAVLEWESPNLDGPVTYTAEGTKGAMGTRSLLEYLPMCTMINETRCDFTAFITSFGVFDFRVRSHYKGEESPWVYLKGFAPDRDTKIGPPSNISGQSILGKINVNISDPVLKLNDVTLSDIYNGILYNVTYWKKDDMGKMNNVESPTTHVVLEDVEAWAIYCIQVNIEIPAMAKIGQTSEPVCFQNDTPAAVDTVPVPQNVFLNSVNFEVILEWEPPDLAGQVTYTAEMARSFNQEYLPVCTMINDTKCDFTSFISAFGSLIFRVKSHYKDEESPWVYTEDFTADRDTIIGPPSNITAQSVLGKIILYISNPVVKLQNKQLSDIYSDISYNVMYWKKNEKEKMKIVKSRMTHMVLEDMDAWASYCIQVNVEVSDFGKIGQTSQPVCMQNDTLGPTPHWMIAVILIGTLIAVFFILVGLFFAVTFIYKKFTFVFPSCKIPEHFKQMLTDNSKEYVIFSASDTLDPEVCSTITIVTAEDSFLLQEKTQYGNVHI
ncbi:interferon alpha/beta receptor 1-like [Erpetoichthys calabaricus]|nr:interferon alpha/beta receptor 1-like [Erpetoichthys calabaricus]